MEETGSRQGAHVMSWSFIDVIALLVAGTFVLLAVFWLGVMIGRDEARKEARGMVQDQVKRDERDE